MGKAYDCAFRVSDNKCSILTKKICGRCSFRLTAEELAEKREKHEERLRQRFTEQERAALKAKYSIREGEK